jgi:hypothetical protein
MHKLSPALNSYEIGDFGHFKADLSLAVLIEGQITNFSDESETVLIPEVIGPFSLQKLFDP